MVRKNKFVRLGVAVAFLCLMTTGMVAAQKDFRPSFLPTVNVSRLVGEIEIDGKLDDSGWRNAAVADGFTEHTPGDLLEPPVKTEARITYDDHNLYVAFIAWDDPAEVRVSMTDRDQIFKDDYVGLLLDTYGDHSWGYELFVNPIGIQGDLRMLSTGNEDLAFDIVWDSRGMVTDSGFQVEIAIPFSSLRFPDKTEQAWRLNFWRDRQRESRNRYSWAAISRDDPCFMCQWGTATGIQGVRPGSNLELIPNVIAHQSGASDTEAGPSSNFENQDPSAEFALNARYGLSSDASAEITINPDFSQVESDPGQIDVNTPFALFFEERRPFFQEGSDLYGSWIDAIHTRSINDPQEAVKLTGRFGRTSVAYILARDDHSPMILPSYDRSFTLLLDKSTVNIARTKRTLGENSFVGGLLTDRRFDDGGAGTVFGVDGSLRMARNYKFNFQVLGSRTDEPIVSTGLDSLTFDNGKYTYDLDGEKFWGSAAYAAFERSARHWNFTLDYSDYSPTFRADNGFITRNNMRNVNLWTGLQFQPNTAMVKQWQVSVDLGHVWEFHSRPGEVKDQWVRPSLFIELPGQTQVNLEYLNSREVFRGQMFEGISVGECFIYSRFSEMMSLEALYSFGRTIWRTFQSTPVLGNSQQLGLYLAIKPTQRLVLSPDFHYAKMNYPDAYLQDHPGTPKKIYEGYILRSKLTYQFTREWFLRLVVQYDDFSNDLNVEPLLTYRLNPFTIFYVGATSRYQHWDANDYTDLSESRWDLTSRQYFAKFQYLFRL